MSILLTGAGGFLGRHLRNGISDQQIITLGRHTEADIQADITAEIPRLPKTDMVIHAAGKAHVIPQNHAEGEAFQRINFRGTQALAEQITASSALPRTFVFVSTVAVYGLETGSEIEEHTPLKGGTPYADSKIQAEQWILDWGLVHGVDVVILRLPLIVGKDAPGNLGAMVRNIRRGTYARIGTGEARRSMVLADDLARLMPTLHGRPGIYNLTDGIHPSFAMMEDLIAGRFGKKILNIPPGMAAVLARVGDLIPGSPFNSYRYGKLRQSLTFSHTKAVRDLGWIPTPIMEGFEP